MTKALGIRQRQDPSSTSVHVNVQALLALVLIFHLCFSPVLQAAEGVNFPQVEKPAQKFYVGERLTYVVSYLGISVGQADSEVKEIVELNGRKVYHIVVSVKSYPLLDWIYKVRDEHHTFMDVEYLYPLRYEKILSEGRYRANEVMTYGQENHTAHFYSRLNKSEKEMLIPKKVQDQLSCGYYFRTLEVKPNTTVTIPVNADEKNWELEIDLFDVKPMEIEEVGKFAALEAEPKIKFQGIFVKRGKIRGWISMDERRIPLRMQVKIPILGSVVAQLSDYKPGQA